MCSSQGRHNMQVFRHRGMTRRKWLGGLLLPSSASPSPSKAPISRPSPAVRADVCGFRLGLKSCMPKTCRSSSYCRTRYVVTMLRDLHTNIASLPYPHLPLLPRRYCALVSRDSLASYWCVGDSYVFYQRSNNYSVGTVKPRVNQFQILLSHLLLLPHRYFRPGCDR